MIAFRLFVLNSLSESLFRFFSSFEQPFFENITIISVDISSLFKSSKNLLNSLFFTLLSLYLQNPATIFPEVVFATIGIWIFSLQYCPCCFIGSSIKLFFTKLKANSSNIKSLKSDSLP